MLMSNMLAGMFWTASDEVEDAATLWFPDGDFCATVYGNLGLDLTADEVAELICSIAATTRSD